MGQNLKRQILGKIWAGTQMDKRGRVHRQDLYDLEGQTLTKRAFEIGVKDLKTDRKFRTMTVDSVLYFTSRKCNIVIYCTIICIPQ